MTHEEEFTLKLKFQDTYKAVANYIRNGLGIKRDDVEKYIQGFVREVISGYDFYPVIKDVVRDKMAEALKERYSYTPESDMRKYIERAIRDEVTKQVSDVIKDQVKVVLKEQ